MADTPQIVTQRAERWQIARSLAFPKELAPYINWDSIAQVARELGAHFDARTDTDGTCTVRMFWTYESDETLLSPTEALEQIAAVLVDEDGRWTELQSCADAVQDISLILGQCGKGGR